MMRINLLGGPKVVAAAAAGPAAVASSAIIISAVTLVALGLASAIAFFVLRGQIQDLDTKIKAQETEKLRLAGVKAQAEAYEKTLNDLQQKKDTVDALARSRVGPVELMRALGVTATRSSDLYLKSVGHSGERLVIQGQSNTVESIANFIAQLEQSGSFDDVKLRQSFQNDKGTRTSFDFNVDCVFKSSASPGPETPAAQPGGGAPAPAGRRAGK
jgi:Tfp pilus assembly protein PilN